MREFLLPETGPDDAVGALGWLSSTFARRRGRSRKTRSDVASVSRRRVAAMEVVSAWPADGTRLQISWIGSRGIRSSWQSSRASASADLGPPSAMLSSPKSAARLDDRQASARRHPQSGPRP